MLGLFFITIFYDGLAWRSGCPDTDPAQDAAARFSDITDSNSNSRDACKLQTCHFPTINCISTMTTYRKGTNCSRKLTEQP